VTALLLAGSTSCGSDASHESGSRRATIERSPTITHAIRLQPNPRRQSRDLFVRRANEICGGLIARTEQLRRRYLFQSEASLRQRGFGLLAGAVSAALNEIKALRQPARGRRLIGHFYRAAEAGVRELEQAARDPTAAQRILSGVDPFGKAAVFARDYGLSACQASAGVSGSP